MINKVMLIALLSVIGLYSFADSKQSFIDSQESQNLIKSNNARIENNIQFDESLSTDLEAMSVDNSNQSQESQAKFLAQIVVEGKILADGAFSDRFPLHVLARVHVAPEDVNQQGEILIVALVEGKLLMKTSQGWKFWNGEFDSLEPAEPTRSLQTIEDLEIIKDLSVSGDFHIFTGYRVNNTIHHAKKGHHFSIYKGILDESIALPLGSQGLDINHLSIPAEAEFLGQLHVNGQPQTGKIFSTNDTVDVLGRINIAPNNIGETGEILRVASYQGEMYMKTPEGWVPWDGQLNSLISAEAPRAFQAIEDVEIENSLSLAGEFEIFFAYRVNDALYYNSRPLMLTMLDEEEPTEENTSSTSTGTGTNTGNNTDSDTQIDSDSNPDTDTDTDTDSDSDSDTDTDTDIDTDNDPNGIPLDPKITAPPLDPTGFTSYLDSTSFLYSGDNPLQTGVGDETIEADRVAVIRGKVMNNDNQGLSGVTIQIKDHPEFGQTLSRTDGEFDLVVNGGGLLTINYSKTGYLPIQRKVQTPWAEYAYVEEIVMIPLDNQATLIDLSNSSDPFQVAQGSISSDVDGTRQATLLFPQGTTATMTLADGTIQALTQMTVRATEYTVGENGPQKMPGPLPASSGYTYAVELSVDEAITAGAETVNFNQKVPFYVDNFLNFPVGEIVPVGYYDKNKAAWIPSPNGKVIKIISITDGIANLDVTGDDLVDTGETLADLGITEAEQIQLASLYLPGKSLWRVQIEHLTPWDCNWPYGPPEDAEFPPNEEPSTEQEEQPEDPCEETGCIIQVENQVLGEDFSITGSEFSLHYRSNRVPGRKSWRKIKIPLSSENIPASLLGIKLTINVAGQTIIEEFPAEPNQVKFFTWNGLDSFGRQVSNASAEIKIEYTYKAQYYPASSDLVESFALPGKSTGSGFDAQRDSATISLVKIWDKKLFNSSLIPSTYLGDYTLSNHHAYDATLERFYSGNGGESSKVNFEKILVPINTFYQDSNHNSVSDLATDAKGNIYFISGDQIVLIDTEGKSSIIAGSDVTGFAGDGGLASEALLSNLLLGIAVEPNGTIYFSDHGNARIRKIDTNGIITTIAGTGHNISTPFTEGSLAINTMTYPVTLTLDNEGNLYFVDETNRPVIRKISPNGKVYTVAGMANGQFSNEGGLATENGLSGGGYIEISPGGELYILEHSPPILRKVSQDGIITTIAGSEDIRGWGFFGDGGPASQAKFHGPSSMVIDKLGNIYIADFKNARIRLISQEGIITTYAGNGKNPDTFTPLGLATAEPLRFLHGLDLSPNGNLIIALREQGIYQIKKPFADSVVQNSVISDNGNEIYLFDETGRHLETKDTLTGQIIYSFTYESNGYLSTIKDIDDQITIIERLADGTPVAIISPDGQRTTISLDLNGYLETISNPFGEKHQMTYLEGGLLDTYTDPNGNIYDYDYDEDGLLIDDKSPTDAGWELAITEQTGKGRTIAKTSKEGRITRNP